MECFLFSKKEGQLWIVSGLETSKGKYSDYSTSEKGLLLTEKSNASKFDSCDLRSTKKGDSGCKAKEGYEQIEHFSLQICLVVIFGVSAKCIACQNQ